MLLEHREQELQEKKQYFDFTPTGLRVAKKERDEWVKKTDKIIQDKVKKQGALDPAVKKVANPPDPKKTLEI